MWQRENTQNRPLLPCADLQPTTLALTPGDIVHCVHGGGGAMRLFTVSECPCMSCDQLQKEKSYWCSRWASDILCRSFVKANHGARIRLHISHLSGEQNAERNLGCFRNALRHLMQILKTLTGSALTFKELDIRVTRQSHAAGCLQRSWMLGGMRGTCCGSGIICFEESIWLVAHVTNMLAIGRR